jgi:hypothetical protein
MLDALDVCAPSGDDEKGLQMRRNHWQIFLLGSLATCVLATVLWAKQDQAPPPKDDQSSSVPKKDQAPAPGNRLTIEVTAGDANKPVENASVYVKTLEEHLIKDKKFEVNVKTNQSGVAHVVDSPRGRILVQVVADGWKPYGHWYDITDPKQTIKIHLEKPPKWY